ncbi:hypothetical protein [Modestobacter lacusdianchii]
MQLLLIERRSVQPIYAVSVARRTALSEMQTMERMRQTLLPRLDDPAQLAPTILVMAEQYPPSPDMAALWTAIGQRAPVGKQYPWLAAVTEAKGWTEVEVCLAGYPQGMPAWERLVFTEPRQLNGSPEAEALRRWSFPVMHLTKELMGAVAREHGFYDVLVQRWFCQDPWNGRACGQCVPCSLANRDGVDFAPSAAVTGRRGWRKLRGMLRAAGVLDRSHPAAAPAPVR